MLLPWGPIHARLHGTLRQRLLLPKESRVLVAVSGGQDSLALIRLLLDLRRKWSWALAIAHCDHRWRSDSADNAAYVAQLALGWDLPCYIKTVSDDQAAAIVSEAAARDWRYRQLFAVACAQGYTHIVTGHTASDRAETLLYNLTRGSGAEGLQALTWCRELAYAGYGAAGEGPQLWLVRPMLSILRQETAQICAAYQLRIWNDETNWDLRYARSRIRQELLPALKSFNPSIEQTLAQTAEVLQADVAYLEAQVDVLWPQVVEQVSDLQPPLDDLTRYRLHRSKLKAAPLALRRRVLRRLLQQAGIAPSFKQIEALVSSVDAHNRSQTSPLYQDVVAQVEDAWLTFKRLSSERSSGR
ncbi:MAG: tRNA lysidine(34) synthetase TilS [Elainellaceae cyanobacterium]